jgi:arginase
LDIAVLNVHLDLGAGRRGTDMGPSALHVAGLMPRLRALGHRVTEVATLEAPSHEATAEGEPSARYLDAIIGVVRELAERVERVLEDGQFPLVLGGDHAQAIGTIGGLVRYYRRRGQSLGVLWVDAHTDMNTPETSPSGNVHGMPLAALLGFGPAELVEVAGAPPALDAAHVAVFGARSVDRTEGSSVTRSGLRVMTMSEIDGRGASACLAEVFARVGAASAGFHLSFDLDSIDPEAAPGVGTPVPGGLSLRESHLLCELAEATGRLRGAELVELNPTLDVANKTGRLGVWLLESTFGRRIL